MKRLRFLAITTILTTGVGCQLEDLVTPLDADKPTANAGPDQVITDTDGGGVAVTLDGSRSIDPNGTVESWVWTENNVRLATGEKPTLTLQPGVHQLTLTVTDNGGKTDIDRVVITVSQTGANQAPTAHAGPDQSLTDANGGGEAVTLDGSRSADADGSIALWVWTEGGAEKARGEKPVVTLQAGVHQFTLTVTDNDGKTDTDGVVITVTEPGVNQLPTAQAGPDQAITDTDGGGVAVTLDGSRSADTDGTIARWVWTEGGVEKARAEKPVITLQVGVHELTLTVTDNDGATDTDRVLITITGPARAISYAADIQPYFNQRCIRCHGGGTGDRGVNVDTYANLMAGGRNGVALVVPGDSSRGILVPKLVDGHKGAPHGTTIVADLNTWIEAGARNN